jgi:hypothetical protein
MPLTCTGTCTLFCFAPLISRYYEGGVSSVYLWDLEGGFAGVILLKKSMRDSLIITDVSQPRTSPKVEHL